MRATRLILASKSPRRREILSKLTSKFEVVAADIDEGKFASLNAHEQCLALCREKALRVFEQNPDCAVIGSDTVVELDGKVYGKPRDLDDARRIIGILSGATHTVHTSVCILAPDICRVFETTTDVTFYELSPEQIEQYILTDEPYDKAGGYGIQDGGALFVRDIRGDYFNVMGFPLARVYRELTELGLDYLL